LILAVAVTGANVQDRDGGQLVLKGLKDRFPRLARVWANGVYAGRLVEWAEKTARVCARYRLQTKGTDWLFRFAMALDRGANLRMAGQLPSPSDRDMPFSADSTLTIMPNNAKKVVPNNSQSDIYDAKISSVEPQVHQAGGFRN
jgi:hypothetical protein